MKTYEYSKTDIDENNLYDSFDVCEDKDEFLDKLFRYLESLKLSKALKRGHKSIETQNYVGVIKYKKFQLDILPKMLRYQNEENSDELKNVLKNLMFMLSYTKKLDIKTTNIRHVENSQNPFIEILILEYANSLFNCLKRLTPKQYIREEDNLNYMRGKLKFSENIRYNCSNQAKFYCEFDEFSENNLLNQLFFYVTTCLYKISQDSKNKKLLKFISDYFCDIKFTHFDRYKAEKIKLSKNQELFKTPFNLAKMFVNHSSIDLSGNKLENITILWDMNILFEEFICELIRKHTSYYPKYQKGKRLLIESESRKKYGGTFVDMYVEKDNKKIIIDTKYKLNSGENNDFENEDIYQLMTYCLIHDSQNAVFIYPAKDAEQGINKYYLNTEYTDKLKTYSEEELRSDKEVKKILSSRLDLKCDIKSEKDNIAKYIEEQLESL